MWGWGQRRIYTNGFEDGGRGPGCFQPPSLWWFVTAAIRNQNPPMCSLRTLLRETPRFTHLLYLLEVSINEVSCFSRIPIFPVVFNHISNKHFQFLPFTKESVVGSRKEIHYSWKSIVELMEKTTVKWTRGWDSVPHSMSLLYLHLALGVTLDSSSLPQSSSFPSGLHQNIANFEPLLTTCLENSMDREAWQAAVRWVAKSQTWLKQLSTHTLIVHLLFYFTLDTSSQLGV